MTAAGQESAVNRVRWNFWPAESNEEQTFCKHHGMSTISKTERLPVVNAQDPDVSFDVHQEIGLQHGANLSRDLGLYIIILYPTYLIMSAQSIEFSLLVRYSSY